MSYPKVRPFLGFSSLTFLRANIISSLFSIPAFDRILRNGEPQAIYAIRFPKLKSSPSSFLSVILSLASSKATPPPGSNPSSNAALVA
jgi:hypothetical protein